MRYKFLRFPGGREKALTCSYDDGCLSDKRLIEIANQHGISVTLNINSSSLGNKGCLSTDDLKQLMASGNHEIAIHGERHIALGRTNVFKGICEVLMCKQKLEQEFNTILRGMAYADSGILNYTEGVKKEEIFAYLKELDIAYARSLNDDNDRFEIPQNLYEWIPTAHHNNPELMNYLNKFLDAQVGTYPGARTPFLFYLWGHSSEFNDNNNWEVFEKFCRKAGGYDNIWYATNIEICDYVNAYRALKFDVDHTKVYNPSCHPVWFEADGKTYCANPGVVTVLE